MHTLGFLVSVCFKYSALWYDKRQVGQRPGRIVLGGTIVSGILLLSCLVLAIAIFGSFRISVSVLSM